MDVERGAEPLHEGGALEILAVAVAGDGRIFVGGYLPAPEPGSALEARLNPDGSLDPTFGTDGFLLAPAEPRHLWGIGERLVAHPDGTFVALGQLRWDAGSDGLIWRFDQDGGAPALVTTGTGSLSADLCETPQVVEDAHGRIVLVHSHLYSTLVCRYAQGGLVDPGFGAGGVDTFDEAALEGTWIDDPYSETVAILPDGRVAVGLYNTVASSRHAAVAVLWD